MKNFLFNILSAVYFISTANTASATTVNFDSYPALPGNGSSVYKYDPLITEGFIFTPTFNASSPGLGTGSVITQPSDCQDGCADNGTQYFGGSMSEFVMKAADSTSFGVYGFDAAKAFYTLFRPTSILVEGTFAAGGTTSAFFTLTEKDFSSFTLSGFVDLSSIKFSGADAQGSAGDFWIGVDNIRVSPVPEPEQLMLFLSGLVIVGGTIIRRRSQKTQT